MTRMSTIRNLIGAGFLASLVTVTGCSTHLVSLSYDVPEIGVARSAAAPVTVEPFRDKRGTDPDWLGAIRGGYGNPIKKLRTTTPTAELVTQAFRDALAARGVTVDKTPPRFVVTGAVKKLDCSYYMNREAHAHLFVRVLDAGSRRVVFENLYRADQTEGGVQDRDFRIRRPTPQAC